MSEDKMLTIKRPSCFSCLYCREAETNQDRGECRRNTPFANNSWPSVTSADFCGEWLGLQVDRGAVVFRENMQAQYRNWVGDLVAPIAAKMRTPQNGDTNPQS